MSRDVTAQIQREQLHRAAQDGDLARVNNLIERKYPLSSFDELGKTPLHYAIQDNQLEIVKRLIEAGADPTIRGWMQMNALDRARERKDANGQKIVRLLEEAAYRRQVQSAAQRHRVKATKRRPL